MAKFTRIALLCIMVAIPIFGAALPAHSSNNTGGNAFPAASPTGEGNQVSSFAWQLPLTATPTNTPTPGLGLPSATGTPVVRLDIRSAPMLYAFIRAPSGTVTDPFVILTAYRSVAIEYPLKITGSVDGIQFICSSTPCRVPVSANSQISFRAEDPFGGVSSDIHATARVERLEDGYTVTLEQISQFFAHRDACATQWGFGPQDTKMSWNDFPQRPDLLATNKTLHYLAGQLIRNGVVNANDCPGKGFDMHGAPNLCGIDRARAAMVEWQNLFDFDIWLAGKDLQIPPHILKVLIEVESQFWPANERAYVDEIGLGQINQLGIDVLLRADPDLYHQICPSVLGDCSVPYPALPESLQKLIRGALLNSLNAYCPSCENKIDVGVTRQSITFIGLLLRANCKQVAQVMDFYEAEASYEDQWKFTLMSYHSGLSCMENAVEKLTNENEPTDWKHVARKTTCRGSAEYVDRIWASLDTFESARLRVDDNLMPAAVPDFLPTPTPIPTIGPPPSSAVLWVIVILDENLNGVPESNEWVNGILVTLRLPDGTEHTVISVEGKAVFELNGLPTGAIVTVSLPSLYRSSKIVVPQQGIVPVVFVFFPPPISPVSSQTGIAP